MVLMTSYKQIFTLLVVPDVYYKKNSSSKDHTSGYTYWLFYNDDIYNGVMEQGDDSLSWYRLAYKGDVPAIINNLTTTSTDAGALNASQGKVLKDLIDAIHVVNVVDSIASDSATDALSANQGKVLNESKMNHPIYSTIDLTPGVSKLADGQLYIVYYN